MARDKLDELSHELSDRERLELLRKLAGTRTEAPPEPVNPVEIAADERRRLIAEDMERVSWFSRLVLWLEGLLSGKDAETLFLRARVREIKTHIRQVNAGLTGFETRDLRPRVAELIYELFTRTAPVAGLCRTVSRDTALLDTVFSELMERALPAAKKTVDDFLPVDEMERIYLVEGSAEEVRKQLLRSVGDYLKGIPREVVALVEEAVRPLISLEKLVGFSYGSLFRYFDYEIREPLEQKYPTFDSAPAMLVLGHLERLLFGLHLAREIPEDWTPPDELVGQYLKRERAVGGAGEAAASDALEKESAAIREGITEVLKAARVLSSRLPLLDILRYFRGDPYYRLQFPPPVVDAMSSYTRSLRGRLLEELRVKGDAVKLRVIERKIGEFFGSPLAPLAYYNDHPDFDYRKLGMPYFGHTRSLLLLHNYLRRVYRSYVHDVVQLASTAALAASRLVQNRLLQSDSQVEDLDPKIAAFDSSLGPDQDEGKALMSFRHNLASDMAQQRSFKTFIAEKDRQARGIAERAQTHMGEVCRVLDETINSPTEGLRAALRTTHVIRGKSQSLLAFLTSRRDNLRDFLELLERVLSYEKGI